MMMKSASIGAALLLASALSASAQTAPAGAGAGGATRSYPGVNDTIITCPAIEPRSAETLANQFETRPRDLAALSAMVAQRMGANSTDPAIVAMRARQAEQRATDWPYYCRYRDANAALKESGVRPNVVFMGDSITEGWVANDAAFFEDNGYVGRGIGGQTSSHFLLRFREDVIKLAPALVVINAGTNDIAENAGAYNEEYTFGNIVSMVELARANKIKVILTSVLPAAAFGWNPSVKDAPQKIMQLNARIRKYAQENKIPYVDYYSEMVEGDNKALNSSYTRDGVHPTLEGYKVMEALIKKAIDKVL